jgi:nucleoside 2-deoxyribosyltransferase
MAKIVLCGSAKNHEYIKKLAKSLEDVGFYVFLFPDARHLFQPELSDKVHYLMAAGLTYDHFEKIKKSDIALFANLDGYMGNSATLELGIAAANSKHIVALNHDKELARECLFNDVLETEDIEKITAIMVQKFSDK